MINSAQSQQDEIVTKEAEFRKQELLDHYDIKIENEIIKEKSIYKKIIDRIQKQKKYNHQF